MSDVDLNPYASPRSPQAIIAESPGDGEHCPACSRDVGISRIGTLSGVALVCCPWCNAELVYQYHWSLDLVRALLGLVVAAIAIGALLFLLNVKAGAFALPAIVGIALSLWLPVERALALYLRKHGILKRS